MKKTLLALTVSLISHVTVASERSVIMTGGYMSITNQTIEDIDYTGITAGFNFNGNTAIEATYSEDTMGIDNQNIELISLDYVSHFDLTPRIKLETKVGTHEAHMMLMK